MFKHGNPFLLVIAKQDLSENVSTLSHQANRVARQILQAREMPYTHL
jgi:hypothetical protein